MHNGSTKKSKEWPAIYDWLSRNGVDSNYRAAYKTAFHRKDGTYIAQEIPDTSPCVSYRIITNIPPPHDWRKRNGLPPRCYVWWQGQSLDTMKHALAYLTMAHEKLDIIVLY